MKITDDINAFIFENYYKFCFVFLERATWFPAACLCLVFVFLI